MNNWNFTGNLGKDAEQRFLPKGDSIVSFSVAVKSGYGDNAKTTWANCAMFGKRGESVLPYLLKGMLVGISGEVTLRDWADKEGGKRQSLDVRVDNLTLLGSKSEHSAPAQQAAPQSGGDIGDMTSDVPF